MKYIQQRGNTFVFEDDGWEIEALYIKKPNDHYVLQFGDVIVWHDFDIEIPLKAVPYAEIQTAVAMMQILIDEGVV